MRKSESLTHKGIEHFTLLFDFFSLLTCVYYWAVITVNQFEVLDQRGLLISLNSTNLSRKS